MSRGYSLFFKNLNAPLHIGFALAAANLRTQMERADNHGKRKRNNRKDYQQIGIVFCLRHSGNQTKSQLQCDDGGDKIKQ
jgi:hypothetical protein